MPKRKIIRIDEEKCNGCGKCLPNCPEGALQIIDGKVRLISDLFKWWVIFQYSQK